MSYERAMSVRKKHVSPGYLTYYRQPVMICQGHMQYLWDTSGKRYLDLFGGIVTVSVGHCQPKVKQALRDQMDLLWHTTNIYLHPKIHEYAEKLVARLPGDLKVCYFTNSGSEANELAVKMARLHTARHDVVALRNAYHGASPYTVALTASSNWQYNLPRTSAVVHAVNPYLSQKYNSAQLARNARMRLALWLKG
ncbi:PREDICTED: LOW QUALITY PROTEIN: alanine--glyoxylate aminotransferase 2 homolog 1, mitochondrial-like [Priapulus caudatus]|uniref:Alanine--glyoxylate aminotransferase 2, mitochondrial n=1 Tax=Priapulus caudatus TaxID=37621 RepID=A0ABM1F534_PRICU|nr:PREDICTED: LOW QUALITY PROTEIN: alanine--glyoxylate aminotransferase 2 homolog 1, mitochondrial-like [Priapulus caudatus]